MSASLSNRRNVPVIHVDGTVLYNLGQAVQPILRIHENNTFKQVYVNCLVFKNEVEQFVSRSEYESILQLCLPPAKELIEVLDSIQKKGRGEGSDEKLGFFHHYQLEQKLQEFEHLFRAELRNGNLFLTTPKAGYDIKTLILDGGKLFPSKLDKICSVAIPDIEAGARCLAFELYTASGFHFHRANESVVLRYMKFKKATSEVRNLGEYIKALRKAGAPEKITSCLANLAKLHRNPLMHPEDSINNLHEAIALLNSVHTAITEMMKEINKKSLEDSSS